MKRLMVLAICGSFAAHAESRAQPSKFLVLTLAPVQRCAPDLQPETWDDDFDALAIEMRPSAWRDMEELAAIHLRPLLALRLQAATGLALTIFGARMDSRPALTLRYSGPNIGWTRRWPHCTDGG